MHNEVGTVEFFFLKEEGRRDVSACAHRFLHSFLHSCVSRASLERLRNLLRNNYACKLQRLFTIVSLSKRRTRSVESLFEPQQRVGYGLKIPIFRLFKTHENKKKQQMWNGEMDCNRFSGPMCPLKFHDVCTKVGRLSPTFANSSLHSPTISTARSCPLARENTRIHGNFYPRRRFSYPPALRLVACIPRIIRILQQDYSDE